MPKEKRRFGYFALPVLVGDDIVAALDLKTDRQNKKLLLQKWNWVGAGATKLGPKLGQGCAQGISSAGSRRSCTASSGFSSRSEGQACR